MSELEQVINKIFDEQEAKFKQMIQEAKDSFTDCYDKFNNDLEKGDK